MDCITYSERNILRYMEDTVKIFVLGFKKWAKLNKVNQTQIGKVVGKVQTTVSDYWNGVSRPSTTMIEKWVDKFNLDYKEILATGRDELKKEQNPTLTEEEIRRMIREERQSEHPPTDITTERHKKLLDRFRQKDLALEINQILIEIEDIDMETLKDAITVLNLLKIQAEKKAAKKRSAANEKD